MVEKIVREKVEEHKHKEDVKQRELQGLHDRAVSNLEYTKEEKQHLREENVRLKQELRSVKIRLSKQHASERVTRAKVREQIEEHKQKELARACAACRPPASARSAHF